MRLFFHQRLDRDLANFILAHKPLHSLYVSPLKRLIIAQRWSGARVGNPTVRPAFWRQPPGGKFPVPFAHGASGDQGIGTPNAVPGFTYPSRSPRFLSGEFAGLCRLFVMLW